MLTALTTPSLLTAVPPGVVLLVVAILVALLPRRAGHALGIAAAAVTLAWVWTIPAGAYLQTEFLGFEAVLFNVDQFSRLMGVIPHTVVFLRIIETIVGNLPGVVL